MRIICAARQDSQAYAIDKPGPIAHMQKRLTITKPKEAEDGSDGASYKEAP